jgi:hypothetical protein
MSLSDSRLQITLAPFQLTNRGLRLRGGGTIWTSEMGRFFARSREGSLDKSRRQHDQRLRRHHSEGDAIH